MRLPSLSQVSRISFHREGTCTGTQEHREIRVCQCASRRRARAYIPHSLFYSRIHFTVAWMYIPPYLKHYSYPLDHYRNFSKQVWRFDLILFFSAGQPVLAPFIMGLLQKDLEITMRKNYKTNADTYFQIKMHWSFFPDFYIRYVLMPSENNRF